MNNIVLLISFIRIVKMLMIIVQPELAKETQK